MQENIAGVERTQRTTGWDSSGPKLRKHLPALYHQIVTGTSKCFGQVGCVLRGNNNQAHKIWKSGGMNYQPRQKGEQLKKTDDDMSKGRGSRLPLVELSPPNLPPIGAGKMGQGLNTCSSQEDRSSSKETGPLKRGQESQLLQGFRLKRKNARRSC